MAPPSDVCALDFGDDARDATDLKPLHKSALIAGLNAVRPQVDGCYLKYRAPGNAMVKLRIALDGTVRSATVTGTFAGTPTGACVEAAVKTARFTPSTGIVTLYSFQLR